MDRRIERKTKDDEAAILASAPTRKANAIRTLKRNSGLSFI